MILKRLFLLVQQAWREFFMDNCSQMAAAISYHVIFAIAPLLMFGVALFGMFADTERVQDRVTEETIDFLGVSSGDVHLELSEDGRARIEEQYGASAVAAIDAEFSALNEPEDGSEARQAIAEDLDAGGTATIAGYELSEDDVTVRPDNFLTQTIQNVIDASPQVSLISFLILAYAASGIFSTVRRSLDAVWGVRFRRPMVPGKLMDLAMLAGTLMLLVLLFLLSIAITAVLHAVRSIRDDPALALAGGSGVLWWALELAAAGLVSFLFCLLAYRYGPSISNHFGDIWLGALVSATGFELLKQGYGIYINNFSSFDVIYGALAGVLLFMLFINLAATVFLFGAELAAEYPRAMSADTSAIGVMAGPPKSLRQSAIDGVKSLFVRRQQ